LWILTAAHRRYVPHAHSAGSPDHEARAPTRVVTSRNHEIGYHSCAWRGGGDTNVSSGQAGTKGDLVEQVFQHGSLEAL
jgi:hypothetical protein